MYTPRTRALSMALLTSAACLALTSGCNKDQTVEDDKPVEQPSPSDKEPTSPSDKEPTSPSDKEPTSKEDPTEQKQQGIGEEVAPERQVEQLARDQRRFTATIYGELPATENAAISPYGLHTALAMTWAGAQHETARRMAQVIEFSMMPTHQHDAALALRSELAPREAREGEVPMELAVANRIWVQKDYPIIDEFTEATREHYGAEAQTLDFKTATEEARQAINAWVAEQTKDKIPELLPPNTLNGLTRLVLTNTVYFKGDWLHEFPKSRIKPEPFTTASGEEIEAPMMHLDQQLHYHDGEDFDAVSLPYQGGEADMVVVLPKEGTFEAFVSNLDAETLAGLVPAEGMENGLVNLTMPKFTFRARLDAKAALMAQGLERPFDENEAEFGGMTPKAQEDRLYISDILHEVFIAVDEDGTEAAAATAAVVTSAEGAGMDPPVPFVFTADRPFMFVIRHTPTNTPLFVGHVVDPRAE